MRYPLLPLATMVAAAAVSVGCGDPTPRQTAGTEPSSCSVALAAFTPRDTVDRDVVQLQDQARRGIDRDRALEQLGYRFLARARQRSDDGDYVLAEQTADCLLGVRPDHASALLLRGHVLHQMHRFAEAEALARRLVAMRQFVLDYGLLGDVLMERGRLTDAADAYQKMIDLKPFYQSYARAAHLSWLKGDVEGATGLMRMAIGAASPRDPESSAWAYSRLAAYEAQAGRLGEAAVAADQALVHQEDYAAALLMKGRVLLAQKRPEQAVDALHRASRISHLPEYQWALADALRLVDRHAEAETVEHDLVQEGARSDPRTVALFLSTRRARVDDALTLAERELALRGDVFTLDAVAWALAAAGRIDEAEPLIARALAEGTLDGRLFLHAAAIAAAGGRHADARRWLARAERLRPMLLPSELDELDAIRTGLSATQEKRS